MFVCSNVDRSCFHDNCEIWIISIYELYTCNTYIYILPIYILHVIPIYIMFKLLKRWGKLICSAQAATLDSGRHVLSHLPPRGKCGTCWFACHDGVITCWYFPWIEIYNFNLIKTRLFVGCWPWNSTHRPRNSFFPNPSHLLWEFWMLRNFEYSPKYHKSRATPTFSV